MSVIHVLCSRLLDSGLDQWCSAFGNEKSKFAIDCNTRGNDSQDPR